RHYMTFGRQLQSPTPVVGMARAGWGMLLAILLLVVGLCMASPASAHSGGLDLAYVVGAGAKGDELVVVDIRKQVGRGQVTAQIPIGGGPSGVALSGDSRFAYVTQSSANSLAIVDAREQRVVDHMPLGRQPTALLFDPVASFNLLVV